MGARPDAGPHADAVAALRLTQVLGGIHTARRVMGHKCNVREHLPSTQGAGELAQGWGVDAGPGAQMHGARGSAGACVTSWGGHAVSHAVVTSQIRGLRDSWRDIQNLHSTANKPRWLWGRNV
jgi:hypothetical protein